jgi:hypothetical protein
MKDLFLQVDRCSFPELVEELARFRDESDPELARRLRRSVGKTGAVLAAAACLGVSVEPARPFALLVMLGTLFFGVAAARRVLTLRRRVAGKLAFVSELASLLRDDLSPRAPLRVRLDLRGYEHPSKLERTARSSAGRTKEYYSDKWLHLRIVLAEGSAVEIVRQAGVKEKSGRILSEKRRLAVSLRPSASRYGAVARPLAHALSSAEAVETGRRLFRKPPEVFGVRVSEAEGVVTVRVSQRDVEFTAVEAVSLVAHIVREAARLARRSPGG